MECRIRDREERGVAIIFKATLKDANSSVFYDLIFFLKGGRVHILLTFLFFPLLLISLEKSSVKKSSQEAARNNMLCRKY